MQVMQLCALETTGMHTPSEWLHLKLQTMAASSLMILHDCVYCTCNAALHFIAKASTHQHLQLTTACCLGT